MKVVDVVVGVGVAVGMVVGVSVEAGEGVEVNEGGGEGVGVGEMGSSLCRGFVREVEDSFRMGGPAADAR